MALDRLIKAFTIPIILNAPWVEDKPGGLFTHTSNPQLYFASGNHVISQAVNVKRSSLGA